MRRVNVRAWCYGLSLKMLFGVVGSGGVEVVVDVAVWGVFCIRVSGGGDSSLAETVLGDFVSTRAAFAGKGLFPRTFHIAKH